LTDHDVDCRAAVRDYRTRLGWTAHTIGTTVWLAPATPIEAFNVPHDLGLRTVDQLAAAGIRLPVIRMPGPPDRWALLVTAHNGPPGDVVHLLAGEHGRDIGYAYLGHHEGRASDWGIDLPPTRHPGHEPLTWVTPADTPLPAASVVAQILADLLARRGD
jgi:hypothetical protein